MVARHTTKGPVELFGVDVPMHKTKKGPVDFFSECDADKESDMNIN